MFLSVKSDVFDCETCLFLTGNLGFAQGISTALQFAVDEKEINRQINRQIGSPPKKGLKVVKYFLSPSVVNRS